MITSIFHLWFLQMSLFAGHQSVQSQVQPKYQHDQKVHRGAHRQAVYRAKPVVSRRVQLRGVGGRAELPGSTRAQTLACEPDRQDAGLKRETKKTKTDSFIHFGFGLSLSAVWPPLPPPSSLPPVTKSRTGAWKTKKGHRVTPGSQLTPPPSSRPRPPSDF